MWAGPRWPRGWGPAARLLPPLFPEGPFHSLRESISVASANRALGAGEGCPAGLVGVPQPRRVGTGTVTAAPLPPRGWNAGKGHRKAVALSQKRADIKGDRLKPSHPALFFSSVRQKPPSPWSLQGPLHALTTSGHLLLPMLVPRPKGLLPSPFMQIPPGTEGCISSGSQFSPTSCSLCVSPCPTWSDKVPRVLFLLLFPEPVSSARPSLGPLQGELTPFQLCFLVSTTTLARLTLGALPLLLHTRPWHPSSPPATS